MLAAAAFGAAGDAHAAFTGFSVVVTQSGTLKKCELFANFSGATDTVLNAFHFNRTVGGGAPVFRHADALTGGVSSSVVGSWNPQFVLAPGAFDSFVCIGGGEGFASGNSTNADPDWGVAGFNQAQVPFLPVGTTTAGAGWFNANPPNIQGLQSGGRVKLGQFALGAGDPAVVLFVKIGYNTGPNTTVVFAEGTFTLTGAQCADCDLDGVCDSAEIAQDPSLDCNLDGALDACQIAQTPALDCNSNGRLDSCDIAQDSSLDCNGNLKIDACEISQTPALDCNSNGRLDSCDIAQDPSLDCNGNLKIDACDISSGGFSDCDGNGVLDVCEGIVEVDRVQTVQVATGSPVWAEFDALPPCGSPQVELEVRAIADLGDPDDALLVRVEVGESEVLFLGNGVDCPAVNLATLTRSQEEFNSLISDGRLSIRVAGICSLNSASCAGGGVTLRLRYFSAVESADCNGNGRLDRCDIASGASTDLDADGVPDECSGQFIVGGSGFGSIADALQSAPSGAVIKVAPGTYGPIVAPAHAVAIEAIGPSGSVAVDAAHAGRCYLQESSASVMALRGIRFVNGMAALGGGALIRAGSVTFEDCLFQSCMATERGGGCAVLGGNAVFDRCSFELGSASWGGALLVGRSEEGVVEVHASVFRSCTAELAGGGIHNEGVLSVTGSEIAACSAPTGGGVHFAAGSATAIMSTFFCSNADEDVSHGYEDRGGNLFGVDCDGDGTCDLMDSDANGGADCDLNGSPDACDIAQGAVDEDSDGSIDACERARGDLDLNGRVDGADMAMLLDWWGRPDPSMDPNGDGLVDAQDLAVLLDHWGWLEGG